MTSMKDRIIPKGESTKIYDAQGHMMIDAPISLSSDIRELAKKLNCDGQKVADWILYSGYESIKAIVDGNDRAVTTRVGGKFVTEGFKDTPKPRTP